LPGPRENAKMTPQRLLLPLIVLTVTLSALNATYGPRLTTGLHTGAATAAHNLCSATFISELPAEETTTQLLPALMGRIASALLSTQINQQAGTADAWLLTAHAQAKFTPGYGCRLQSAAAQIPLALLPAASPAQSDCLAPPDQIPAPPDALQTALDEEFTDPPALPPRYVHAILIIKNGRIATERYAPGHTATTPEMSFSVAKSFTNALLAILVRQNRIDIDKPAPIPEWHHPDDPRGRITPDDLLRMQSGLFPEENGAGSDPASIMFYGASDMAVFMATQPAVQPPRQEFAYNSGNTLILDRLIGQIVGGGPAGIRAFAQKQLFDPLNIHDATMEFDSAGTWIGASHFYASARSYAKFGMLYLNDGIAPNGQRILPAGWVAYSKRATLNSLYGAGFWTLSGNNEDATWLIAHGFPKDGFWASGNLGQRIYIVPSENLIMVRLGTTKSQNFGITADMQLLSSAIKSLK